uniref:Uncharacterized protein n=1 Tax=Romanomermis culicivorax TaxID=13658 RepID=A0A915L2B8_ROMCU
MEIVITGDVHKVYFTYLNFADFTAMASIRWGLLKSQISQSMNSDFRFLEIFMFFTFAVVEEYGSLNRAQTIGFALCQLLN